MRLTVFESLDTLWYEVTPFVSFCVFRSFRDKLALRYNQLPEFQTPEIGRVPLQEHLLGILCDVPEELPATYLKKAMNAPEAKKARVHSRKRFFYWELTTGDHSNLIFSLATWGVPHHLSKSPRKSKGKQTD